MSFEMSVALADKLLKIRNSCNNRLESARTALAKAHEKKPDIDPKILHLQKELEIVKEIKTGPRQDVPSKVANLMGINKTRPVTKKGSLPKLFK
jgi:predicted  nucleic acid-binding Zn-ribbon protein